MPCGETETWTFNSFPDRAVIIYLRIGQWKLQLEKDASKAAEFAYIWDKAIIEIGGEIQNEAKIEAEKRTTEVEASLSSDDDNEEDNDDDNDNGAASGGGDSDEPDDPEEPVVVTPTSSYTEP